MVAIKKIELKKKYSSAGGETREFGSDAASCPPPGAGSDIFMCLSLVNY